MALHSPPLLPIYSKFLLSREHHIYSSPFHVVISSVVLKTNLAQGLRINPLFLTFYLKRYAYKLYEYIAKQAYTHNNKESIEAIKF